MIGNHDCFSPNHIFHVCSLKKCGLNEENFDDLAKLVKDPQFRCKTCGAKANNAGNLCEPEKMQA